jgi:colanic acid biosynthesis glycosyl transferase WcaI
MTHRILYLSPYFWPEEIGSAPYCTELAIWLRERGHDLRVVSFRPHYPNPSLFEAWRDGSRDEETHADIPITRVPVRDRGRGRFKDRVHNDLSFFLQVALRCLRGEFKNTEVVVAYVPTILTLYCARLVRLFTGASIICVVHDIESGLATSLNLTKSSPVLFFMRLVERVGLNFAEHVVALSEAMQQEIQLIGCRRAISVLSIWASVADFSAIERDQTTTLMYSGNFGKKQNLDQLLPLIQRLSEEKQAIRVVLQGDGSERRRLQEKITRLGINNTVFRPLVPAEKLLAALQAVNIHIVPQALNVATYSLPSKLFSIMAAGRPFVCIAEKGSPLDELAQRSDAGLCIHPGDEDALYTAIAELANDHERQDRMGQNGRRLVENNMSKASILKEYEDIIARRSGSTSLRLRRRPSEMQRRPQIT